MFNKKRELEEKIVRLKSINESYQRELRDSRYEINFLRRVNENLTNELDEKKYDVNSLYPSIILNNRSSRKNYLYNQVIELSNKNSKLEKELEFKNKQIESLKESLSDQKELVKEERTLRDEYAKQYIELNEQLEKEKLKFHQIFNMDTHSLFLITDEKLKYENEIKKLREENRLLKYKKENGICVYNEGIRRVSESIVIFEHEEFVSRNVLNEKMKKLAKVTEELETEKRDVQILETQLNQTKRDYNRYKEQRETGEDFQLGKDLVKANKQIEKYKTQMELKDKALERKNVWYKKVTKGLKEVESIVFAPENYHAKSNECRVDMLYIKRVSDILNQIKKSNHGKKML